MNRLLQYIIILIIAAAPLASCDDNEPVTAPQLLVVEGSIDSGRHPVVLVTLTATPMEQSVEMAENIVRWGVVRLSDGQREVVLTGGPDLNYFPPYRYYTTQLVGEPGKTYSLTVEYGAMYASSSVTMPPVAPQVEITRRAVEFSDTLSHLEASFTAPLDVPAFFHLSYRMEGEGNRFLPSMLGTLEVTNPGERVTLPVYRCKSSLSSDSFQPEFPANKIVEVKLERVSEEVFRFWRAFDDASLVEGSIFVSGPGSMPTNIIGGLGVWSAQSSSTALSLATVPPNP